MLASLPFQSFVNFGLDAKTFFLVAVSLEVTALVVLVSAYYRTHWRLESESRFATCLSETFLPIVKERDAAQDIQGYDESPSTVLSVLIDR